MELLSDILFWAARIAINIILFGLIIGFFLHGIIEAWNTYETKK